MDTGGGQMEDGGRCITTSSVHEKKKNAQLLSDLRSCQPQPLVHVIGAYNAKAFWNVPASFLTSRSNALEHGRDGEIERTKRLVLIACEFPAVYRVDDLSGVRERAPLARSEFMW